MVDNKNVTQVQFHASELCFREEPFYDKVLSEQYRELHFGNKGDGRSVVVALQCFLCTDEMISLY